MQEQTDIQNGDSGEKYIVHIDNFEGPLDLLWTLIRKAKIDITEVSISTITEQYLLYLGLMDNLNVKIAIEFITMASELLYYKSKALLPTGEIEDEYFIPPLPPELIQKLLEYKKYQQASLNLSEQYDQQNNTYVRQNRVEDVFGTEEYLDVSLFDLLKAFARVMDSKVSVERDEIIFDEILVSDRIDSIIEILKENEAVIFTEIFDSKPTKPMVVATFLAILEMAKTRMIKVVQHRIFGDIRLLRNFSLKNIT